MEGGWRGLKCVGCSDTGGWGGKWVDVDGARYSEAVEEVFLFLTRLGKRGWGRIGMVEKVGRCAWFYLSLLRLREGLCT